MVSFLQVQCLNCGKVEDLPQMSCQTGETWCSQCCGFTRPMNQLVSNPSQLFQKSKDNRSTLREDEELVALFSKNLFLSEPLEQQRQQQQNSDEQRWQHQSAVSQTVQSAAPAVNYSISQHYHHYRPVALTTETPAQPSPPPAQPSPPSRTATPPSRLLEQLQEKAAHLRAEAYADYHRQLQQMEEQYNRQQIDQQYQNPGLIGSPVSTAASINDDYQLQMSLLEQERQNVQLQQQEENMILQQLMSEQIQHLNKSATQEEDAVWSGARLMPPETGDLAPRAPQELDNFYHGIGDNEMLDDEESPCVIYHSRNYRMQYHFI